jgi:hypothetical protein
MESGPFGFAPLNLLVVVLVFGLVLLLPWCELWRKPVMREATAKGRGRSSRKQGQIVRYARRGGGLLSRKGR